MPRAFAVFTSMTNSDLIDCWMGNSFSLGTFKNLPSVDADLAISFRKANSVTHQPPACHCIFTKLTSQAVAMRQRKLIRGVWI